MLDDVKVVKLTASQLIATLQIIEVKRSVDITENNKAEATYLLDLMSILLRAASIEGNDCELELTQENCFATWLCLDVYKQFLEATDGSKDDRLENEKRMRIFATDYKKAAKA